MKPLATPLILLCLLSGFLSAKTVDQRPVRQTQDRPNIVLIMADDMGFSDLGCYGSEIPTPHIDSLATEGIRFTQFYNTAKCWTTRASLLTGLYYQQITNQKILTTHCVTIAEVLRDRGYHTWMSGKWHLSALVHDDPEIKPIGRGFQRFFGTTYGAGSYYDPWTLQRGTKRIEPGEGFYYTDGISEDAVKNIRDHAGDATPFFQYVSYTAPHWPMQVPEEVDLEPYKKIYLQGWDVLRQKRYEKLVSMGLISSDWKLSPRDDKVSAWEDATDIEWRIHMMAVYAAMVARMDEGIGKILQALKETDKLNNTLIFFLSDNGGSHKDIGFNHGLFCLGQDQVAANGKTIQIGRDPGVLPGPEETFQNLGRNWANLNNVPFRLFKTWSHEGGISTPLIVRWPETVAKSGSITHQVGHVIDIMATCLQAAGADYPARYDGNPILPIEGQSLVPAMKGEDIGPRTLFWEFADHGAVRDGDWKLVALSTKTFNWELYNLEADRSELNNLAAAMPDRVDSMAAQFSAWREHTGPVLNKEPPKK